MMLEIRDVEKKYGKLTVLDKVSLDVEKGDVVAILGPSGSGKTTFLRCLNFLERADAGRMVFDGIPFDLHAARREEVARLRGKTAFVFQNYNLFLNKSALQNVMLGLVHGAHVDRNTARRVAVNALERVGMGDRLNHYPSQLSGGQQQRVAIARALAMNPEIIFFDEPTSALDPELIGEVLEVMKQLALDGMTMLVVTHEMDFARNVSNKVMFMEFGKVIEAGPTRQFFEQPKEQRSRDFVQAILSSRE